MAKPITKSAIAETAAAVLLTGTDSPELAAAQAEADAISGHVPPGRISSEDAPVGYLLIVSRVAGFRRANIVHPLRAEYPLDYFSAQQLSAIRAEPMLTLVEVGGTAIPAKGIVAGPGAPFEDAHGVVVTTDAELEARAEEAVASEINDAADAGIKARALRDEARERFRRGRR